MLRDNLQTVYSVCLWWLERARPPRLVEIFGKGWKVWPYWSRCVTGVGVKGSSPCQGRSSLHSAFRARCKISVCLLTHSHASYHDGETWSEPPMKCFPLQAALVSVLSQQQINKTRPQNWLCSALDRDVAQLVKDLTARHEALGWFPSAAENQI